MTREDVALIVGEEALFPDGLDQALIGVAHRGALSVPLYDMEKCIQVLVENDGMDDQEAREYFDYNILNAWHGELTPMYAQLEES